MENTSQSLLQHARDGDERAWDRIVELYRPLIRAWLIRQSISAQEAEDLAQDVLVKVVEELRRFQHAGRVASFRSWLRTITANRAREFWRSGRYRAKAAGGSDFRLLAEQLQDEHSYLSGQWEAEHNDMVLGRLLEMMETEFAPATLLAFRRLTYDRAKAADVAAETGMSVAAVYGAKARVLQRLRSAAEGLLD